MVRLRAYGVGTFKARSLKGLPRQKIKEMPSAGDFAALFISRGNKRAVSKKGGFGECTLVPGCWYRGTSECTLVPLFGTGGTSECTLVPVFGTGGTSECTLVLVFGTGEHSPKPPFWKPPLCEPPIILCKNRVLMTFLCVCVFVHPPHPCLSLAKETSKGRGLGDGPAGGAQVGNRINSPIKESIVNLSANPENAKGGGKSGGGGAQNLPRRPPTKKSFRLHSPRYVPPPISHFSYYHLSQNYYITARYFGQLISGAVT